MSRTAEQYGRAARSSHLRMDLQREGDVDTIVAAGWARRLGTMLLRCRVEWDGARAAIEQAERRVQEEQRQAEAAARMAPREAQRQFYTAEQEAATSRLLILLSMGTLRPTAALLLRAVTRRARERSMTLQPAQLARIAGAALDIWLDQRCPSCTGRGYNGGAGAPMITCRACRGTKTRRRQMPWQTGEEHVIGEWLLAQIAEQATAAEGQIRSGKR